MPPEYIAAIWRTLIDAGAVPAGLDAYEILRVEAGTPHYGIDIDETNLPQEVGRTDRAISFTKGCYIGQETIARIRTYGHVNRQLVGLVLVQRHSVPAGTKLYRDDKEVGHVTSAVVPPVPGPGVALGYVRRGSEELGTVLYAAADASRFRAEVVLLPLRSVM